MRSPLLQALSFSIALVLAGCGGGSAEADNHGGFEPVTCSAQPSPCA